LKRPIPMTPVIVITGLAAFTLILFSVYRYGFKIGQNTAKISEISTSPSAPSSSTPDANEAESNEEAELELPNLQTYQEQGTANPHQTPRVLIDFAHAIADHMEAAQTSKVEATKLFSSLENCAQSAELPQARAICAINAGRLSDEWPDFSQRNEKLRQELPDDVKRLVQALD
jgi:hypothetical protein